MTEPTKDEIEQKAKELLQSECPGVQWYLVAQRHSIGDPPADTPLCLTEEERYEYRTRARQLLLSERKGQS